MIHETSEPFPITSDREGLSCSWKAHKWLEALRAEGWRGARRVYGRSFYGQGTNDTVTSADQFIAAALALVRRPRPDRWLAVVASVPEIRTLLAKLIFCRPLAPVVAPLKLRLPMTVSPIRLISSG